MITILKISFFFLLKNSLEMQHLSPSERRKNIYSPKNLIFYQSQVVVLRSAKTRRSGVNA